MQSFHDIWEPVLKALSEKFSDTIMELWFNHLELAAFSDTTAALITDSDIKAQVLTNRHKETLCTCFEEVLGFPIEVCILSDEKAAIDRKQLQHDAVMGLPIESVYGKSSAQGQAAEQAAAEAPSEGYTRSSQFPPVYKPPVPDGPKTGIANGTLLPHTDKTPSPVNVPARYYDKNAAEEAARAAAFIAPDETETSDASSRQGGERPVSSLQSPEPFVNSDYTFDNFIVGSSNKFAHAACIAVANNPATAYNPLFIHGPSGLGKTHLLYAITNRIREKNPDANIVYVKGETFTNQLIESIAAESTAAFRARYRQADVFLIDDVQFIAGKTSTQEEFFNTFNELYEARKQIILTSDRPPKEIRTLEDRLKTRFEWGLIADIEPPDLELRIAILRKKALDMGVDIPMDVLNFLGEHLKSNIRQIEGVIRRLGAYSNLTNRPITVDMARENIADVITGAEPIKVTQDKIFNAVAKKYDVTVEDIKGKRRTREIALARHVVIYIMRTVTDLSLPAIGKVCGRDHTTVLSSIETIQEKIREDASLENDIDNLIKEITNQ